MGCHGLSPFVSTTPLLRNPDQLTALDSTREVLDFGKHRALVKRDVVSWYVSARIRIEPSC